MPSASGSVNDHTVPPSRHTPSTRPDGLDRTGPAGSPSSCTHKDPCAFLSSETSSPGAIHAGGPGSRPAATLRARDSSTRTDSRTPCPFDAAPAAGLPPSPGPASLGLTAPELAARCPPAARSLAAQPARSGSAAAAAASSAAGRTYRSEVTLTTVHARARTSRRTATREAAASPVRDITAAGDCHPDRPRHSERQTQSGHRPPSMKGKIDHVCSSTTQVRALA